MPIIPSKFDVATLEGVVAAVAVAMEPRIGVMFAILFVSLFAVSFPTLSKQVPFLRIPAIVFFIGKHFGTGVILATAFIHLLDDAFQSLQNPTTEERYGHVGKWTGLIILGSLLSIFLVEYISTSYVEHLQDKPSAPPTPVNSPPMSPELRPRSISLARKSSLPRARRTSAGSTTLSSKPPAAPLTEITPLLLPTHPPANPPILSLAPVPSEHLQDKPSSPPTPVNSPPVSPKLRPRSISRARKSSLPRPRRTSAGSTTLSPKPPAAPLTEVTPLLLATHPPTNPPTLSLGPIPKRSVTMPLHIAHTSHPYHHHHAHHAHAIIPAAVPIQVLTNSPRICRLGFVHDHVHGHECRYVHSPERIGEAEDRDHEHHRAEHRHPRIGRRRQIVGILVLQLGIMIHSLVIGLTLAVTSGSEFTSLTTAIIFHQLFEGFSLGIRIAALPPRRDHNHDRQLEGEESSSASANKILMPTSLQAVDASLEHSAGEGVVRVNGASEPYRRSPTRHERSDTVASCHALADIPSVSSPPASSSTVLDRNGSGRKSQSRSPSHPGLWSRAKSSLRVSRWRISWPGPWSASGVHWLNPTLSLLFAVTTPFGIGVGMSVWKEEGSGGDEAQMLLIQGVMSAISAGMLIYAATVEMIAGDFVFGDVEGHYQHHHGHEHEYEREDEEEREHRQGKAKPGRPHSHSPSASSTARDLEGGLAATTAASGAGSGLTLTQVELDGPTGTRKATMMKRILAVASLFAGSGMMVLIGLGE